MKVSVSIITYNNEKYIAQAVDSVLMQEADFDYEILIGEDDSQDNTRAIVKEYAEHFPDKIRLFLNDRKNVIYVDGRPTGRWNFVNNWNHARGEYIAALDGDDYWTSPHKLQKQVDFLEAHPECAVCFHNVVVCYEDGGPGPHLSLEASPGEITTLADVLAARYFVPTCSVMYRGGLVGRPPDWYYDLPFGDWPLLVLHALHGDVGYIEEPMGTYRVHGGGMWSGCVPSLRSEQFYVVRRTVLRELGYWRDREQRRILSDIACIAGVKHCREGRPWKGLGWIMKSLWHDPACRYLRSRYGWREVVSVLARAVLGQTHRALMRLCPWLVQLYRRAKRAGGMGKHCVAEKSETGQDGVPKG